MTPADEMKAALADDMGGDADGDLTGVDVSCDQWRGVTLVCVLLIKYESSPAAI